MWLCASKTLFTTTNGHITAALQPCGPLGTWGSAYRASVLSAQDRAMRGHREVAALTEAQIAVTNPTQRELSEQGQARPRVCLLSYGGGARRGASLSRRGGRGKKQCQRERGKVCGPCLVLAPASARDRSAPGQEAMIPEWYCSQVQMWKCPDSVCWVTVLLPVAFSLKTLSGLSHGRVLVPVQGPMGRGGAVRKGLHLSCLTTPHLACSSLAHASPL